MKIVETVYGYYYYHLSESGKTHQPTLCGREDVMSTEIPLGVYGYVGHLNEKWCEKCWKIYSDGLIHALNILKGEKKD